MGNISQLPVCRGGESVGSLSESHLMARVIEDPAVLAWPTSELMDAAFPAIGPDEPLPAVGRLLTRQNPAVLVRDGERLVGIITRYDMVRYLTQ